MGFVLKRLYSIVVASREHLALVESITITSIFFYTIATVEKLHTCSEIDPSETLVHFVHVCEGLSILKFVISRNSDTFSS